MSKTVESIKLFFRNGETWTVQKENIGDFWIKRISTSIGRINGSEIKEIKPCDGFKIEILPEADHVKTNDINLGGLEMGMFSRAMKYEDILKMDVSYSDNEIDEVYFPYLDKGVAGEEGLDNRYQTTRVSATNSLYIVIDPEATVTDLFGE